MPRSNIRLLTKDERQFFKDNYEIIVNNGFILVINKHYKRITAHPIDVDFAIASKVRKIKITTEAINLWKEKFINTDVSLIEIQNAMNALTLSYQYTNYEDVKNQLERIKINDEKNVF